MLPCRLTGRSVATDRSVEDRKELAVAAVFFTHIALNDRDDAVLLFAHDYDEIRGNNYYDLVGYRGPRQAHYLPDVVEQRLHHAIRICDFLYNAYAAHVLLENMLDISTRRTLQNMLLYHRAHRPIINPVYRRLVFRSVHILNNEVEALRVLFDPSRSNQFDSFS